MALLQQTLQICPRRRLGISCGSGITAFVFAGEHISRSLMAHTRLGVRHIQIDLHEGIRTALAVHNSVLLPKDHQLIQLEHRTYTQKHHLPRIESTSISQLNPLFSLNLSYFISSVNAPLRP